jgi:hypothetical protein
MIRLSSFGLSAAVSRGDEFRVKIPQSADVIP